MNFQLIADSCCDMTPQLRQALGGLRSVPLSLSVGGEEFIDDEHMDLSAFLAKMKASKTTPISACPSPQAFLQRCVEGAQNFIVTLSANLSATFQSAMIAKDLAKEEGKEVYVFNSKSASAGEVLISYMLQKFINAGHSAEEIIKKGEDFISSMRTFFVLKNLDNLVKNGRMNKVVGAIATVMNICPIMGEDGDGNIKLYSQARGQQKALEKLVSTIGESGKSTKDSTLVITHCNNPDGANTVKELVQRDYQFEEVLIVPTRGLSSLYANDGGVIIAF